jgi:hypothetical protein
LFVPRVSHLLEALGVELVEADAVGLWVMRRSSTA